MGNPNAPESPSGCGSPVWSVNKVNLNLYVTDTPLWYRPAYGPSVDIQLSYNSQGSAGASSPFGPKWRLGYASYLVENTDGSVKIVMPDGREDLFVPDGKGGYGRPHGVFNTLTKTGIKRYTLSFLDGTVYTFAIPAGTTLNNPVLAEIRDSYNQALMIEYDTNGRLWKVRDTLNGETVFSYNTQNLVEKVTDPFGRTANFEYYANKNLRKATDMGGYWTEYVYDAQGYLSEIRSPNPANPAQIRTWGFKIEPSDSASNPAVYPDPNAAAPKMGKRYRVTITDPLGNKEEYFYTGASIWYISPRDYVEYVDQATNNMMQAPKTYYTFDRSNPQKGKIARILTPEGRSASYTYDYDPVTNTGTGNIATITDGNNHAVKYEYNNNGLLTKFWDAKTPTTATPTIAYTYYPNNVDLWNETNGLGSIIYEYNTAHDITAVTDRIGVRTEAGYNVYGQIATITEAKGTPRERKTTFTYDTDAHTLSNIKRSGTVIESFTYDLIGRIKTDTHSDGLLITYDYDNLNQIKTITYPDGKMEQINSSSACPNIVDSIRDRAGLTTTFTHDALKRLARRAGPEGILKYGYDNNSNLTTLTVVTDTVNDTGPVATFGFDLDNRLASKTYNDNKSVSYTYDPAGLLKTFTNARSATITYSYDENNNLATIDHSDTTPDVTFTYDSYDRPETRTDGIGFWQYGYYPDNRLKTIDGPWDSDTITFWYDELGRVKTLASQGDADVSYGYDTQGRLETITKGTEIYTYGYETIKSPLVTSLTRPNGSKTQYTYNDPLNRLTLLSNKNSDQQVINSYAYTYNTLDLRDKETITNGVSIDNFIEGTATYTPNDLNQITGSTNPDRTFSYDNDGNMTTGYTPEGYPLTLSYDAENRLISAEYTDSGSVTHKTTYDYSGDSLLSVMKKYDNGALTKTSRYIRAGFLPIQERNENNGIRRRYLWGLNAGGGIGGLLTLRQASQDYTYLYDGKGNVTALADSSQTPVVTYSYDPFGALMKKTGTLDQPFQFSTKEYDPQTGLSYFGYRFYSSSLGRWSSRDPIGETGGANLYDFVGNNSVNRIDSFGLWGADVHSGIGNQNYGTYKWAIDVGFSPDEAAIIARADNDVDGGPGVSWLPLFGDQSRHFNQPYLFPPNIGDTRDYWAGIELDRAFRYAAKGHCITALKRLGKGLHSIQDKYPHRDWDTGIFGAQPHPPWYDSWTDPRNKEAARNTETATKNYLRMFLNRMW